MLSYAGIILVSRRRILLLQRDEKPDIPNPGKWDIIGGAVEQGETPEAALVREVEEETGFSLASYALFLEEYVPPEDTRRHIYWSEIDAGAGPFSPGTEGRKLQFIPFSEIERLDLSSLSAWLLPRFIAWYRST